LQKWIFGSCCSRWSRAVFPSRDIPTEKDLAMTSLVNLLNILRHGGAKNLKVGAKNLIFGAI
jgi:hypothetical protein